MQPQRHQSAVEPRVAPRPRLPRWWRSNWPAPRRRPSPCFSATAGARREPSDAHAATAGLRLGVDQVDADVAGERFDWSLGGRRPREYFHGLFPAGGSPWLPLGNLLELGDGGHGVGPARV